MHRFSSAHAIALVALFFAVGGGGYAIGANTAPLPTITVHQGKVKPVPANGSGKSSAACKRGEKIIAGGASTTEGNAALVASAPRVDREGGPASGWFAKARNVSGVADEVQAMAVCIR
jgi:hypothetical protein